MKRVYENDKIRVIWDSDKCIHVANCTNGLPEVFNLNRRPWVDINAADVEKIKRTIDACPSGALSYEIPGQPESDTVTIKVLKNGPYKVSGNCRLIKANGEAVETGKVFALCRCGASKKMPFCDGTHLRSGFQDTN
jgi:uncharacterized Fe-S cluster protein YjdI